ncbi:MAG: adenylate/guanylate cyclase domain-containing protein [Planctomycetota bacterium]
MYELVFLSGARAGAVIPVAGTALAGRDSTCAVEVPDPRVSRMHARFEWDGVALELIDANSSNGTFVNEQPVSEAKLGEGDVVRLGATRLRVRLRGGRRRDLAERTAVFGFRDAAEPMTSHAVSMTALAEQARRPETSVLQHRLSSLMHVAEILAKVRVLPELYEPVLDVIFDLFPQTDRSFLMLGDTVERLEPCAVRERGRRGTGDPKVSRSICRAALQKRAAFIYREGGDERIQPGHSVVDLHIRSAIAVPLLVGDDVLGMVVLDTRDATRAYTPDDLELAAAIGQQVAIAVRNAQLLSEVEAQTAMRNNLMRFLPEAMANLVLEGKIDAGLGGVRYRGTILFSDVIGFTGRAEQLGPEELVDVMNRYFNRLVPCIEHEGGSIDKFMGDAIMAVWGIPIDDGDSAVRAVAAALAMQVRLAAFNTQLTEPLPMGIGIGTGEVVAGNIGAENRREYTVLGDTVNTAQRIGGKACREQVLVSENTWSDLSGRAFGVRMPPLRVKNKSEPVQTLSIRGLAATGDGGGDEEIQLYVPVDTPSGPGVLARRLPDSSFLLMHTGDVPNSVTIRAIELPPTEIGGVKRVANLPAELEDGKLCRSVVRLGDPTLGGLLDPTPKPCAQTWETMSRGDTALQG